ncbi:hypothetical protein Q5P01_025037 [Channa striata]|uniref:Lysozyme g n=1 Tax=Channa striata TaxID=64152 RepID=A0AA88IMM7_CHASR|nr:hypothetical protein Q5P01_025037 [Channa striata]
MAETDAERMKKYREKIMKVGDKYEIDPALIAGIISRESRAGNTIKENNGWGDYDPNRDAFNAYGLMQVDVNPNGGGHTPQGGWDSEEHLCQATEILVHFINKIHEKFPNWSAEQQLKGGIAAYNMGDGKHYKKPLDIDFSVCSGSTYSFYFEISIPSGRPESGTRKMGYGDIMKVETSGASVRTAQQDKLTQSGVPASHTMAKTDAGRMEKYREKITKVGHKYGIDPALIAAIISRESRAGNVLHDGWGDYDQKRGAYNAWGLMQVDVNPNGGGHTARGGWDSEEHLCQATEILVHFINTIRGKFPTWSAEQQLKGAIAAYNMGDRNVRTYDNVDGGSAGGDYSNDVVARAQWYKKYGGF